MKHAQGFTLLATLFILVLLAMAGAFLLRITAVQQQSVNYNLLATRAHHAALSALALAENQYQLQQRIPHCTTQQFHFDKNAHALSGFDVIVNCKMTAYPNVKPTFISLELHAIATYGRFGDRDYVSQQATRWVFFDPHNE